MSRPTLLVALLAFLVTSPFAGAHEFWIEPSQFDPGPGDLVRIGLRQGERFAGQIVPRRDAMIERFEMLAGDARLPVAGRDGGAASFVRPAFPGLAIVVYQSRRYRSELDAAAFERYLREEGLDAIAAARAARGETDRPGREVYSRCAKALVVVGDPVARP